MRIAVVGCGYWGSKHVRVLSEHPAVGEVIAVDADPTTAATLGELGKRIRPSVDLRRSLQAADAAVIATPPGSHAVLGLQAIAAGCDVLVEKPLAPTAAEAERLVFAAGESGRMLMTGHTFEYNPAVWRLRSAVRSGELGTVRFIDSVRLNLGPIRRDVNVVQDLAPHDISISNFVLGAVPDAVTAWGGAYTHPTLEDTATLRLEYRAVGVTTTIRVSWLDPCKIRRTTVVGEGQMAIFDDMEPEAKLALFDRGVVDGGPLRAPSYRMGDTTIPQLVDAEPLRLQADDFIRAVQERRPPSCDGHRGLEVVRVLEAAQRSLATGATVMVERPDDPQAPAPAPAGGLVDA